MTLPRLRIAITTLALLASPTAAWAYIDPGSGSFALQAVLAASAAGYVAIKLYFRRFMSFLRRRHAGDDAPSDRGDAEVDSSVGPSQD